MITRRQWQKILRNPFLILAILIIFFGAGQLIIRSISRSEENPVKSRVWQTVQAMNRIWTVEHNARALKNYFHPQMVAITPGDSLGISGQEACVTAWQSFAEQVRIISWKELNPQIQIYGRNRFAIVTYNWEMDYETDGKMIHSTGRNMLSLVREYGRWWIVADQFWDFPSNN